MRTFKKSSTAIITTLALGLILALPAAAQTALAAPAAQTYTVQVSQADQTESGEPGTTMKFTVVQKPGAEKEIITWVEKTEAEADPENGSMYSTTAEYDIKTARSKAVNIQQKTDNIQ